MPTTDRILFKNLTAAGLHERLADAGVDARTARRLQAKVLKTGEIPRELPEVSTRVLEAVRSHASVPKLQCVDKRVSPIDGFAKYAFKSDVGDGVFEAVRIPLLHRQGDEKYVVCVSSQVGCAMGCTFCATGRMGFTRNLAAWEIVDQVIHIRDDSEHSVRGVVFMGMGEPMLNYDAVMTAAQIMTESCGLAIGSRAITISTVGIVPGIQRFTRERRPYRLIVSLTAATSEKRRKFFPVEHAYPLPDLIAAVREYQQFSGRRMNLAWTMMRGQNTSAEDARALAELTAGLPIRIDLIDVADPTGQFSPPRDAERDAFHDALRREVGMPVGRRYSGGADVSASCGLLAANLTNTSTPANPDGGQV